MLVSILPEMLENQDLGHRKNIRCVATRLKFRNWLFYLPTVGPSARFSTF